MWGCVPPVCVCVDFVNRCKFECLGTGKAGLVLAMEVGTRALVVEVEVEVEAGVGVEVEAGAATPETSS